MSICYIMKQSWHLLQCEHLSWMILVEILRPASASIKWQPYIGQHFRWRVYASLASITTKWTQRYPAKFCYTIECSWDTHFKHKPRGISLIHNTHFERTIVLSLGTEHDANQSLHMFGNWNYYEILRNNMMWFPSNSIHWQRINFQKPMFCVSNHGFIAQQINTKTYKTRHITAPYDWPFV